MSVHERSENPEGHRPRRVITTSEASLERLDAERDTVVRLTIPQAEQLRRIEADARDGARAATALRAGD
ncbi:MAG TPA: hypothetical protein VFW29_04995 [Solirubrobacteraceae bacterium]|nr:hypothetical protein [Solirubrobacteraceae bacterium]